MSTWLVFVANRVSYPDVMVFVALMVGAVAVAYLVAKAITSLSGTLRRR